MHEKEAGNNSDKNIEAITAIADKPLGYKGISLKQHNQILIGVLRISCGKLKFFIRLFQLKEEYQVDREIFEND